MQQRKVRFEYNGKYFDAEYNFIRMTDEDHFFVFPKGDEITNITGTEYLMTAKRKSDTNFVWGNTKSVEDGQIRLAILSAIKSDLLTRGEL